MTKTSPSRTTATAVIQLDSIRTAAREIRTLFPETHRPAINTLMNAMTRELNLGQTYGQALAAATPKSAPGAIPAHRHLNFTMRFCAPDWVRHLMLMSQSISVNSSQDTYRGKPVFSARIHSLSMTGSRADAQAAAQAFVDAHPLLTRSDVKILDIKVTESERFVPLNAAFPSPFPETVPESFDPYFPQAMPGGHWTVSGVIYKEIEAGEALNALEKRLKALNFEKKDGVYMNHCGVRYYIPGSGKPAIVAISMEQSMICQDPLESFVRATPTSRNRHLSKELSAKHQATLDNATLIGRVIFNCELTRMSFRLDPTCVVNGRTVPDATRPSLLVDTGATFAGLSLKDLSNKNRTPAIVSQILEAAGVSVTPTSGYMVRFKPGQNTH